jgi:hypothetical protein
MLFLSLELSIIAVLYIADGVMGGGGGWSQFQQQRKKSVVILFYDTGHRGNDITDSPIIGRKLGII